MSFKKNVLKGVQVICRIQLFVNEYRGLLYCKTVKYLYNTFQSFISCSFFKTATIFISQHIVLLCVALLNKTPKK